MENTDNSASNSISHESLEDHLEKIVQDFSEFKKIALANCSDAITLEELMDMYIFSGGVSLPADSNEGESTLPPHQEQSPYLESINFDEEYQLTDEMAEDTSQNVMHIRYGDLKYQGAADSIIGSSSAETVFQSFMKSFTAPGKGRKSSQKKVNAKKNGDGTTKRKYIKKRYIQIIEANEGIIAHHMGVTNVNKRVHVAYIRSLEPAVRDTPEEQHLRKIDHVFGSSRRDQCTCRATKKNHLRSSRNLIYGSL